jgi:hypothetical protein
MLDAEFLVRLGSISPTAIVLAEVTRIALIVIVARAVGVLWRRL